MDNANTKLGINILVVVTALLWLISEVAAWHVAINMLTGILFALSTSLFGAQWQVDRQTEELADIEKSIRDMLN